MIRRILEPKIAERLSAFPAVAILGPRQVGKTTLALEVGRKLDSECIYVDLERPSDLAKLSDPELFLLHNRSRLVILDEVQRAPELFATLRSVIDLRRRDGQPTGQYLLLGSASKDLLQQSSESLAGRIIYSDLSPLNMLEIASEQQDTLWLRGGYPISFLQTEDEMSLLWRESLITTYLERDIPMLGRATPADVLRRFWTMIAHCQGGLLNASTLAEGLGISNTSVARTISLFVDLFLCRKLMPWHRNTGKRLVKSPKLYIRDSGLLHALLGISTFNDLLGHPIVGASWEGFVVENIASVLPPNVQMSFYRTSAGTEVDLVLEYPSNKRIAIEIKRTLSPTITKSLSDGIAAIEPKESYVVYPGSALYPLASNLEAIPLRQLLERVA